MHEYEFRLVVQQHSSSFLPFIQNLGYSTRKQIVYYVKPYFRFKNGTFETKRNESTNAVYHDNCWFKWVHSVETPYRLWNLSTCKTFLHNVGNYQDPFTIEIRDWVQIDSHAQIYTFHTNNSYKLVFEWEYGTFKKPLTDFNPKILLESLTKYKHIYDVMRQYPPSFYQLNENITRKPVSTITTLQEGLYAHKLDGIFGFVYSYRDRIKEKWEGYECIVHKNITLGDGLVFAAEKLEGGEVFLLDVYQVQGHNTASWCRRSILMEFLPQLNLIKNYFVQTYVPDKNMLSRSPFKTDGLIIHDVKRDVIFKYKPIQTIDLVYFCGYFHLPNGRIKCLDDEELENGCVYEISTANGRVVRKRPDRFKGNTAKQLENILAKGWYGPPIEPKCIKPKNRNYKKTKMQKIKY